MSPPPPYFKFPLHSLFAAALPASASSLPRLRQKTCPATPPLALPSLSSLLMANESSQIPSDRNRDSGTDPEEIKEQQGSCKSSLLARHSWKKKKKKKDAISISNCSHCRYRYVADTVKWSDFLLWCTCQLPLSLMQQRQQLIALDQGSLAPGRETKSCFSFCFCMMSVWLKGHIQKRSL